METPFQGGVNIAIKLPKAKYDQTVAFYRDILKLEVEEKPIDSPTVSRTHKVAFGNNTIWLDCVDNYTHSETWLELTTENVERAERLFAIARRTLRRIRTNSAKHALDYRPFGNCVYFKGQRKIRVISFNLLFIFMATLLATLRCTFVCLVGLATFCFHFQFYMQTFGRIFPAEEMENYI